MDKERMTQGRWLSPGDALSYELTRENRSILLALHEAEAKVADLKIELNLQGDGNLELAVGMARANKKISRLTVKLVESGKEVVRLSSDVTDLRQSGAAVALSEVRFRALFENTSESFLVLNRHGFINCNEAALRLLGVPDKTVFCGHGLAELSPPRQPSGKRSVDLAGEYIATAILNGCLSFDWVFRRFDTGFDFPAEVTLSALELDGETVLFGNVRDATERRIHDEGILKLAFYDALTHLPNRRLLFDRLSQALAQSRRSGRHGAMIFLDLDNFKPLNDLHGHAAGDLLLQEVSRRLSLCVRAEDTVARYGGDEFVILLIDLDEENDAAKLHALRVTEKIRAALAQPYFLEIGSQQADSTPMEHHASASLGVTLIAADENNPDAILKRADDALYAAKAGGRNRIQFFL